MSGKRRLLREALCDGDGKAIDNAIARKAWEEANRDQFDNDFNETQDEGTRLYGMRFVKVQEAMLGVFGGIFPQRDYDDFVMKAMLSRMVLSALHAAKIRS